MCLCGRSASEIVGTDVRKLYPEAGAGPALDQLIRALPADTNKTLVDAALAAAESGEQAVTDAVALIITKSFYLDVEAEPS